LPVPGQEFGDAPCRMVGDAVEQVGDVVLRVESVELGALNQGINRRGAASAGIRRDLMMPGVWDTR
jgi:hypothetical protein